MEGTLWQQLTEDTQPKLGLILFFLILTFKVIQIFEALLTTSFWHEMVIKQPEQSVHFDQAKCLLRISEVTLKDIKKY